MGSEVWFEVIRPALADKQGWALFISTPDGRQVGFMIYGVIRRVILRGNGRDGVIRQLRGGMYQKRRLKQLGRS